MDDLDRGPALPGSLPSGLAARLQAVRTVLQRRDASFVAAFGIDLRESSMREDLVRLALIELGRGRSHHIVFYEKSLAGAGTRWTVAREVSRLRLAGVLATSRDPMDARAQYVSASVALATWARTNTPVLLEFLSEYLRQMAGIRW